jgi:hypothetical protein
MKSRQLKLSVFILSCLGLLFVGCGMGKYDQSDIKPSHKNTNDTIFLLRELADSPHVFYHAIFIDTTTAVRNTLTDFSLTEFDSSYFESIPILKPYKNFSKEIDKTFPRKWISIHQYKNEYFLYYPSDFCYHSLFELTDSSTFERFSCESPEPSRINSLYFQSSSNLIIDRSLPWGRNSNKLQINIIDPKNGIAIFTFGPNGLGNDGFQLLMVDANKVQQFRTVVNYCVTDKQGEFEFDKINYKSKLK